MAMVRDPEDDRTSRRWTWIFLGGLFVLPALAVLTVTMAFDPNFWKSDLIEEVRKKTGRELVLGSPIRLKWALRPTVEVSDVSFSNMEGGSRPEMARVARMEIQLGLLALLKRRLEIDRLTLERPDILLETDAQGRANWRIVPAGATGTAGGGARPPGAGGGFALAEVREVRIIDGVVHWLQPGKPALVLPISRLELDADDASAPMGIKLAVQWNGVDVGVTGQVGALAGLLGPSATPWPVRLAFSAGGATLHVSGGFANPIQGKGYQFKLAGTAPDLAALTPLTGGIKLPALREVTFAAQLNDRGGALPEVTDLSVRAGASDLGAQFGGLKLDRLELAAAHLTEAVKIDAQATVGALPVMLGASLGTPLALLGGRPAAPVPVEMNLTAAGAAFSARGQVADPAHLAGVELTVAASVPDAQALAPLLGQDLPALRDLRMQAHLQTGADGIGQGVMLRELVVRHAHLDLTGELAVRFAPQRGLRGHLAVQRLDLDALRPASPVPPGSPAPPAGRGARSGGRVIPDAPLPFAVLRQGDADVQIDIAELIQGGATSRNISGHVLLKNGQLKLDPFSAELPAGKVSGSLTVDAAQPAPPVALVLRSPGLALKQLYNELGREGDATGLVEVDVDLRGAGVSVRQIAAVAEGHLGLAVVGGTIDNRILNLGLFGDLLRGINLGEVLGRGGSSQLRCFALRVDARGGVGDVRALLLDSTTFFLEGGGRINLAEEGWALRMKVQPRLGNVSIMLPIRVNGSFASPRVAPDPTGLLGAAGQTATGALGTATDVAGAGANAVTGTLGLGSVPSTAAPDHCAAPLAIARGGRAGTGAAGAPAPPQAPRGGRSRNPLQRLLP